ncbi:mitochondrial intermembrane space import and assembly protein 40 homolog [Solanum dulcamara]|uniref:mitochondrial intermembrane space import and assembly protein 40 homolog n=1 Tax=Solanum dulcamara TaxID=45834 RepID=UPI002484D936|nr:mitochondrial intermembrane space import and assembly protein 40 homolog [Solanum dulcamara]
MGQVQSEAIDNQSKSTSVDDSQPTSLDSLIAEAVAYGEDGENESIDEKARKALECPCIAHLRAGLCGNQFSDAFLCFLKSTAEEKGSDCVSPFVALQSCIKANPNAFSKDVLEEDNDDVSKQDEVKTEETPKQEYRIIPPIWSVESKKTRRTKL